MKIICSSTKEFLELMKAFEYLHDLSLSNNNNSIDFDKHPIVNLLCHLYLGEKDLPNKKKFIVIKGRKTLPDRETYRPKTKLFKPRPISHMVDPLVKGGEVTICGRGMFRHDRWIISNRPTCTHCKVQIKKRKSW